MFSLHLILDCIKRNKKVRLDSHSFATEVYTLNAHFCWLFCASYTKRTVFLLAFFALILNPHNFLKKIDTQHTLWFQCLSCLCRENAHSFVIKPFNVEMTHTKILLLNFTLLINNTHKLVIVFPLLLRNVHIFIIQIYAIVKHNTNFFN